MDNDFNIISDYTKVGLNKHLMPLTAPIAQPGSAVGGMAFNTYYDRNAVTAVNLRNFSFNAGTGGTIVLGGVNNGNGNFIIKDSLGSTIVQGNNQGLTINSGSITINNAEGQLSFDSAGVVSSANFPADNVESAGTHETTSTTFVDLPGATLDPFVTTRDTKALVAMSAFGYNIAWLQDSTAMEMIAVDSINGTMVEFPLTIEFSLTQVVGTGSPFTSFGYGIDYQFASAAVVVDLTAGTHTMKLQYKTNGSGTASVALYQLAYVVLGN